MDLWGADLAISDAMLAILTFFGGRFTVAAARFPRCNCRTLSQGPGIARTRSGGAALSDRLRSPHAATSDAILPEVAGVVRVDAGGLTRRARISRPATVGQTRAHTYLAPLTGIEAARDGCAERTGVRVAQRVELTAQLAAPATDEMELPVR